MSDKKTPLTDVEIMTMVNAKVKECVGWFDSRLSRERQRVISYYNGLLPKRQHLGSSPYVSTDVYDSVESMRAQLVETFSANPDNLISFPASGPEDVEVARQATEYCNYVFFRENDGFGLLGHASHDGLTARVGVVKLFWEKITKDEDATIPAGTSYQDVQAVAAQDDVSDLEANMDEGCDPSNPTFNGSLTRSTDVSQVRCEPLPPEEFLITPRCPNIKTAELVAHRTLKSKSDLKKLYPKKSKVIDDLHYDDDKGLDMSPEVLARNMPVETVQAIDSSIQPEQDKCMLYETYTRLDRRDGKGTKLYKVVHVNEVLLDDIEEVSRAPFYNFTPLPIPYLFYGNNFAARVIPTQNARTVLTRAILDHAAITTNPRWGVVKGGLLNPREMIENRLGGIVNLTRPDGVKALEQQTLNPFVFQTLEMLKTNKEESTGISSLSQGLNKDAISTQNSAALVDNLVTMSQTRQKIIARNFAKFLSEVYLGIYALVLENQDCEKPKIIKVAGNFVPISIKDWEERTECSIALHLGYGERDRETAKFQALYKELSSDPKLEQVFDLPHRVKLATDAMKSGGFQNYAEYLGDPSKVQPPPPDPIKMAEIKVKQTLADAAMLTAQTGQHKVAIEGQADTVKQQVEQLALQMKSVISFHAEQRKDAETKARIEASKAETVAAQHKVAIDGQADMSEQQRKNAETRNEIDVSQREITMLEKTPISKETGSVAAH